MEGLERFYGCYSRFTAFALLMLQEEAYNLLWLKQTVMGSSDYCNICYIQCVSCHTQSVGIFILVLRYEINCMNLRHMNLAWILHDHVTYAKVCMRAEIIIRNCKRTFLSAILSTSTLHSISHIVHTSQLNPIPNVCLVIHRWRVVLYAQIFTSINCFTSNSG